MSLINEVLRKLDQEPGSPGSGPTPAQLQPARGGQGRSAGWVVLLAVGVFLAGAGAGGALWWLWLPPQEASEAGPSEAQQTQAGRSAEIKVAQTEPAADRSEETSTEEAGEESAEGSEAEGGPSDGEPARETAADEPPLEVELPPMKEETSRVRAEPPQPASSDQGKDPASVPVKRPRAGPLKVALVPEPERRLASAGASVQEPTESESPARAGGGEAGGDARMRVEVPDSWQRQRRAGELARSGYRALAGERYREAVEQLGEARRLAPDRTDVVNNLALAQWQAGSPGEAINTLTTGLRAHPDNPRIAQNLAHFLLRRGDAGDREGGVEALTTALEKQDRLPLYALVGSLYRKMGQPQEAISIYRSGIARNGAHWRLLVGLGLALEADGQGARAAKVYRRARDELPEGQSGVRASVEARLEGLPAGNGD